jgi:hypothetical protein
MSELIKTGHARLLYREVDTNELNLWFDELRSLDELLMRHPRLFSATPHAYLYFFNWSEKSEKAWVAREVIGFESRLPEGCSFYDTYAGEAFDQRVEGEYWQDGAQLLDKARKLGESFAKGVIANTWRLKLHHLDDCALHNDDQQVLPKISFQFFKNP